MIRKADVDQNIQGFQPEEFVKLEKPEDYYQVMKNIG